MFSLPDWAFYPISAAIVAGMVAGALSLGDTTHRTPEEILAQGLTYEGDTLNVATTGNGLTATLLTDGDETYLRIEAARGPLDGMQSAGAFFPLTPDEREALQGHRVRVSVDVRASHENPARGVRLSFFVPRIGQSSWQRYEVGSEFERIEFDATPPGCVWSFGYIGLWPDWDYEANAIDVREVRLTALEPLDC